MSNRENNELNGKDRALEGLLHEAHRMEEGSDVAFLQELEARIDGNEIPTQPAGEAAPDASGRRISWPIIFGIAAAVMLSFAAWYLPEFSSGRAAVDMEVATAPVDTPAMPTVPVFKPQPVAAPQEESLDAAFDVPGIQVSEPAPPIADLSVVKGIDAPVQMRGLMAGRASTDPFTSIELKKSPVPSEPGEPSAQTVVSSAYGGPKPAIVPLKSAAPRSISVARGGEMAPGGGGRATMAIRGTDLRSVNGAAPMSVLKQSAPVGQQQAGERLWVVDSQVVEADELDVALDFEGEAARDNGRLNEQQVKQLAATQYGRLQKEKRRAAAITHDPNSSDDLVEMVVGQHTYRMTVSEMKAAHEEQVATRERYGAFTESPFKSPWQDPLSTFSIDVDTASYSNIRRMINEGSSVPPQSVRIEEMINYFNYDYAEPADEHPFATHLEAAVCPWNPKHHLVRVGLKGREVVPEARPSANLVFLLDVSGSMNTPKKLPLVKKAMLALVEQINSDDVVSIVVYAGSQGVALEPTSGDNKDLICEAINQLRPGGSTHGSAGITLAYELARKQFVDGGINRVILATDGDFNVGLTDQRALVDLVEKEAKSRVFLTVLGFGRGNLNDAMLEGITNKGNGSYHYIDSEKEGHKVLVEQMNGTLFTIAKDVKIQVEFNPAYVKNYRLVGYDNRRLRNEDFTNDKIDAGDIGSGHTVTALYEVEMVQGLDNDAVVAAPGGEPLKYQRAVKTPQPEVPEDLANNGEWMTVKLRYKLPEEDTSRPVEFPLVIKERAPSWEKASADFRFASAVAGFGLILRESEFKGQSSCDLILELVDPGLLDGKSDPEGRKAEFLELVRKKRG